jgi:hypothetical protein
LSRGSTWLASLSLLARSGFAVGSASTVLVTRVRVAYPVRELTGFVSFVKS